MSADTCNIGVPFFPLPSLSRILPRRPTKTKCRLSRFQEDALEREREEAKRYRLRLVPRVSSVTGRSMDVSLPPFLVSAALGARRYVLTER